MEKILIEQAFDQPHLLTVNRQTRWLGGLGDASRCLSTVLSAPHHVDVECLSKTEVGRYKRESMSMLF